MPAIDGRLVRWKFDHGIARAARPFRVLEPARADDEAGAVLCQRPGVGRDVCLVLLGVRDIDPYDPISFSHGRVLLGFGARQAVQRYSTSGSFSGGGLEPNATKR